MFASKGKISLSFDLLKNVDLSVLLFIQRRKFIVQTSLRKSSPISCVRLYHRSVIIFTNNFWFFPRLSADELAKSVWLLFPKMCFTFILQILKWKYTKTHLKLTYNKKNSPPPEPSNLPHSHHSCGRTTLTANLTSHISQQFLLPPSTKWKFLKKGTAKI